VLPAPMLAKAAARVPTGEQWWMEPKYDGWRILSGILGGVVMCTRTGNRVTQVPYIEQTLLNHFPAGTILDGEIVDLATSRQWNRTQSILSRTSGNYKHRPTEQDPALTYVLFDVLQAHETDVRGRPLSERRAILEELCAGLDDGPVTLIPTQAPSDEGMQALVDLGFEGVVCKRRDSIYRCGARNGGWVKIKPKETVDVEFIGIYEPEPGSKYAPMIEGEPQPWAAGGVRFRVRHEDGRECEGRAAGMDDRLRRELWERPSDFYGCVVELVHWGVQDSGALRFPQVRRLRSKHDKAPAPIPTPAATKRESRERNTTDKPWMRNYGAMGPDNLRASIASLTSRSGEAYERCVTAGGDPAAHLAAALAAAEKKQLVI
jgi:ATP-dependent DNA ligase